jgi:hypothetical protein
MSTLYGQDFTLTNRLFGEETEAVDFAWQTFLDFG